MASGHLVAGAWFYIQKPYMQRRVLATFEKQWILPYTRVSVASRPETFDQYIARMDGDMERLVHILVGDVDRMAQYAQLGYQSDQ